MTLIEFFQRFIYHIFYENNMKNCTKFLDKILTEVRSVFYREYLHFCHILFPLITFLT